MGITFPQRLGYGNPLQSLQPMGNHYSMLQGLMAGQNSFSQGGVPTLGAGPSLSASLPQLLSLLTPGSNMLPPVVNNQPTANSYEALKKTLPQTKFPDYRMWDPETGEDMRRVDPITGLPIGRPTQGVLLFPPPSQPGNPLMEQLMNLLKELIGFLKDRQQPKRPERDQRPPNFENPPQKPKPREINGVSGPYTTQNPGNYGRNAFYNFDHFVANGGDPNSMPLRYTPTGKRDLPNVFGLAEEYKHYWDRDHNGVLNVREKSDMAVFDRNKNGVLEEAEIAAYFLYSDANNDGLITSAERKKVENRLRDSEGQKAVDKMMSNLELRKQYNKFKANNGHP